jgi:cytosine/adenosine deaminase-related metal-dependent hydrolase
VRLYRAEALFDGDGRLLRDAGVVVDDGGTVQEVGPIDSIRTGVSERHDVQVLMPGVVNAHTHLTDAEIERPVAGGDGLNAWVRRLLKRRDGRPDPEDTIEQGEPRRANGPSQSVALDAVAEVLRRMRKSGTVAIGEVCNGIATLEPILQSGMRTRFIQELLAFRSERAAPALEAAVEIETNARWNDRVLPTVGIHAPYSVSPELAGMILEHNTKRRRLTFVHLTEDPAERELYINGGGPWKEYLKELGAWDESWRAPGVAPIEHYDRLGLLGPSLAAVHLADATDDEIALVATRGVRVILSPTSNLHIGNRLPPLEAIVARGIPFALGTDGRGSNPSIDVFDEARLLAERFESLDGMLLIQALTANGAAMLGFGELGRIAPGTRPGLVAIEVASLDGSDGDVARRVVIEPISRGAHPGG